jgi:Bacterial regulatory helix-turn-helix protein, lysR family
MYKSGLMELEAVVAIARHGSFRAAAFDLDVSPTAIGNAVASLENRLGVRSPPTEAVFGDESISPSKLGVDPGHAPSTQDRTSFATASLLLSIMIMWPLPLTPRSPKNQKSALAPFSFSQSAIRTSRWLRRSQAAA